MTNQHAGLSQALAEQRITERQAQAAQARLAHAARPPRHPRRSRASRWRQLGSVAVATDQPVSHPQASS